MHISIAASGRRQQQLFSNEGMARRVALEPHLTIEDLEGRYQSTTDAVERSRWHFLWLLVRGLTATLVASIAGC